MNSIDGLSVQRREPLDKETRSMQRRTLLVALFALLLTAPRPVLAQAQTFDRTFTVSGDATLEASSDSGSITVRRGEGSTIVVHGRVEPVRGMRAPSDAAEIAARVAAQPPVTQDGSVVRLGRLDDEAARRAVRISYEVSVPANTRVSAQTGSGAVAVEGTRLPVSARSGSGGVTVRQIDADAEVRTGSGTIAVESVSGTASASTGSGSISAKGIGRGLQASTGSGRITAALSGEGDVKVSTGSGSIVLTGVVGAVQASTGSGNVTVDGRPTADWKLSAASGSVSVTVPSDVGFQLDARSSSGSLDVDMPMTVQGRVDRHRMQGTVRGGGPTLALSTASGSISVR
jgi:DUF4097 and DUF4098 domain-containing protein YvlB